MKTKRCTGCKRRKALSRFPPDRRASDGTQARCRACINAWIKNHYNNNPVDHMLRRAYARAARKGLAFAITAHDITPLPTSCPVFGFPLTRGKGQQDPSAYSLDRINNALGYVPGKVVVISYLPNRLKNDGTAEQHERIAIWMRSMQGA